jgi:sugar/nucleoside kinase (ribokinase family)
MTDQYDVIVVGSYSVDLIFTGLSEFPQLGKDVVGKGFEMTPGEAYISAVCMHRLGLKVGWAADFGSDEFSQFALRCARQEGLDESLFAFHDRSYRRISAAASYPEERAFITYYDADPQIPAAVQAVLKSRARVLYVPGLYTGDLLFASIKLIRAKGMILVMDGNSSNGILLGANKECKAIRRAIQNTDIFLPNASEARRLTGEADLTRAIRKLGEYCKLVVIKDGANGSMALCEEKVYTASAIHVTPLDTTGAGDNFNAGFLYAWLNQDPIETCLKWGNIVGGLSTTRLGGTTRKITCTEVQEYLSLDH